MRVTINGKQEELEPGTTVAQLVVRHQLQPKQVAVEVNFDLVPRRSFEATRLAEGDEVEIVTLVGGG